MSLPENVANVFNATGQITTVAAGKPLKTGETTLHTEAAPPTALQGTGQFRIVVDNEVMVVTAFGGTGNREWTVERKREGTTEAEHLAGAAVAHDLTAEGLLVVAQVKPPHTITGATTAVWNAVYFCEAGANYAVKLPAATGNGGKQILIKVTAGTKTITLEPNGTEKINGTLASLTLSLEETSEYAAVTIVSDNTNPQVF